MREACFGDLLAEPLRNGVSYPSRTRGSGVPMINMKEIFTHDRIGDLSCELAPLSDKERTTSLLKSGDLLFARQSLTYEGAGKVSLVIDGPDRTWESHLIRARLKDEMDPAFYYYFFRSSEGRRRVETIIQQVAAAGIRGTDLARLIVPVPGYATQRAIGEVLGALDDKIAANSRLEDLTRELLTARFKSLELDLPPNSDCHVISVDDIVELNPKMPKPDSPSAVYLEMKNVPEREMTVHSWSHREPKGGVRFQNGDTVMARITPCLQNGKTAYIDFLDGKDIGVGSTEYIVMRARPGLPTALPYFLAKSPRFRERAIRSMVGTSGRQRLAAKDVAPHQVLLPEQERLDEFDAISSVMLSRVKAAVDESRSLAATRDALLPLLMSGKVTVKDAESVVEGVV